MNLCVIALPIALFLSVVTVASENDSPTGSAKDAEVYFKNGDLAGGKMLLESLSLSENLTLREKVRVYNKLAWFYDEVVGNHQVALIHSRTVLGLPLPESDVARREAQIRIEKIEKSFSNYRKEDELVEKMEMEAADKADAEHKIEVLEDLVKNKPYYYRISAAKHHIGKHYLYLEKYYKSYLVLSDLLESQPGIVFLFSTESLMNEAKTKWYDYLIRTSAFFIVVFSSLLVGVLLFLAKFWEWLRWRTFALIPIAVVAWGLFLLIISFVLDYFVPEQEYALLPKPQFIHTSPWSPGSEILIAFFLYGLLGILFSFMCAAGSQCFRNSKIRIAAVSMLSTLFIMATFSMFYLKNCTKVGFFEHRVGAVFPVLMGHTFLPEQDFEPYVLTNPRAYPGLEMKNTTDDILIEWVEKQYSNIAGNKSTIKK